MSIYQGSVDDNDPAIIYSGSGWILVTQDVDWRGTMHSTSVPGSWARFRFTGSRVAVICTIPTGDGQLSKASFQIDDGPAISVSHQTTPPVQWQTQFWNSGPLPFGSHLLTITNLDNDAYFRMDRIDFDPTDSNAPQQTDTPRPSSTPPPLPPASSNTDNNTPPLSPTASASQQSSRPSSSLDTTVTGGVSTPVNSSNIPSSSNSPQSSGLPPATSNSPGPDPIVITGTGSDGATGAEKTSNSSLPGIIAGVLGGVLVLVLLGIGVYCLRRRRRRMMRLQSSQGFEGPRMTQAEDGSIMPFTGVNSDHRASSRSRSPLLQAQTTQTTLFDSKSRNPPTWRGTSPVAESISFPNDSAAASDMYTSAHSRSGSGDESPSKTALANIDQRLSLINPSEAPPPAYDMTR
ncbi:hypothetical protein BJ165DRAFT_1612094 [Panaeolus papilionaceus]|nr:hypothetical protein BJ165DRAFT_1612094 [Panaeolus papilionaceus]